MHSAAKLARVAADALAAAGSQVLFGVPGGGVNLDMIGAAEAAGIRFVLTHGEAAAAIMAGVHAELTGVPAACVVTRGPGAASSINGVAQALLDRQPVIVLSDTVPASDAPRVPHQRLDQAALFGPVTKWSGVLGTGDPAQVMAVALAVAAAAPPGPVHLDVDPTADRDQPPPRPVLSGGDMAAVNAILASARKPVVLVGVGARHEAPAIRAALGERNVPVLQTYKAKGIVADSAPQAAGLLTGATAEAPVLRAADAIVAIGLDAVELIPGPWPYPAPVVSLSPWLDLSPSVQPAAAAVGPVRDLLAQLRPLADGFDADFAQRERSRGLAALCDGPASGPGIAPWDVVRAVRASAPPGSIATVDAGAHMLVAMPLWTTENPGEVLVSSGLATMGFALPAAIAAGLARPDVRTFCMVGDGGLGMVVAELETLARLELPVTVVVFNDSTLSLIKIKQRASGHGGTAAVSYRRTDFAAIAAACGIRSVQVNDAEQLTAQARASLEAPGPVLLDVLVDPSGYPHVFEVIRGGDR